MSEDIPVQRLIDGLRSRGAPLPFEIAGYIALVSCERVLDAPREVTASGVFIDGAGAVSVEGPSVEELASSSSVISFLTQMLLVAGNDVPPMLMQLVESYPTEGAPLKMVRDRIEAALVPLNRSASKRVLARLLRDADHAPATPAVAPPSQDLDSELEGILGDDTVAGDIPAPDLDVPAEVEAKAPAKTSPLDESAAADEAKEEPPAQSDSTRPKRATTSAKPSPEDKKRKALASAFQASEPDAPKSSAIKGLFATSVGETLAQSEPSPTTSPSEGASSDESPDSQQASEVVEASAEPSPRADTSTSDEAAPANETKRKASAAPSSSGASKPLSAVKTLKGLPGSSKDATAKAGSTDTESSDTESSNTETTAADPQTTESSSRVDETSSRDGETASTRRTTSSRSVSESTAEQSVAVGAAAAAESSGSGIGWLVLLVACVLGISLIGYVVVGGKHQDDDGAEMAGGDDTAGAGTAETNSASVIRVQPGTAQIWVAVSGGAASDVPRSRACEFLVTDESLATSRRFRSDSSAAWTGGELRFDVASEAAAEGADLGFPLVAPAPLAGEGDMGQVHFDNLPSGAKVFRLVGFGPEARVEASGSVLITASGHRAQLLDAATATAEAGVQLESL